MSVLPAPGKRGTASLSEPWAKPLAAPPSVTDVDTQSVTCQNQPRGAPCPQPSAGTYTWANTGLQLEFLVLLTILTTQQGGLPAFKGLRCKAYDFNQITPTPTHWKNSPIWTAEHKSSQYSDCSGQWEQPLLPETCPWPYLLTADSPSAASTNSIQKGGLWGIEEGRYQEKGLSVCPNFVYKEKFNHFIIKSLKD